MLNLHLGLRSFALRRQLWERGRGEAEARMKAEWEPKVLALDQGSPVAETLPLAVAAWVKPLADRAQAY